MRSSAWTCDLGVYRQDRLALRRVEVEADDAADLVLEAGVFGYFEGALPPGLQAVVAPQPRHPGLRHLHAFGELDVAGHMW